MHKKNYTSLEGVKYKCMNKIKIYLIILTIFFKVVETMIIKLGMILLVVLAVYVGYLWGSL